MNDPKEKIEAKMEFKEESSEEKIKEASSDYPMEISKLPENNLKLINPSNGAKSNQRGRNRRRVLHGETHQD